MPGMPPEGAWKVRKEPGLYIPVSMLRLKLSKYELLVAAEVAQLKNCHAKNRHFIRRFGCSKNSITDAIKGLISKQILEENNGEKRIIIDLKEIPEVGTFVPEDDTEVPETDLPETGTQVPESGSEVPETGGPSEQELTRPKKKVKLPDFSPDVLSLGKIMAKIRREISDIKIVKSEPDFYYAGMIQKLLDGGEVSIGDVETVVRWLDENPKGRECFKFGMANMPKTGYTHVFIRNFASNLATAKSNRKATEPELLDILKTQWPGTHDQRYDPTFNPGPGWKQRRFKTSFIMPQMLGGHTVEKDEIEWVRDNGSSAIPAKDRMATS